MADDKDLKIRALLQAMTDSYAILLAALLKSGDLTAGQIKWVVQKIEETGEQASGERSYIRRREGPMLIVMADELQSLLNDLID